MGLIVPRLPIEYGNDCQAGIDSVPQLWPAGQTPKYVYACFDLIERCNKPQCLTWPLEILGWQILLEQDPFDPCFWGTIGGPHFVFWRLQKGANFISTLRFTDILIFRFFNSVIVDAAKAFKWFPNQLNCVNFADCGFGGFGAVLWNPGPAGLLQTYGFDPTPGAKFDAWPIADEKIVIRTVNKETSNNVRFTQDW